MNPSDSGLLRELRYKIAALRQFKASLDQSLQTTLDQCEWSILPGEGQGGVPLMCLRLATRIHLDDPFLSTLAEQAERYYGPVDFALFSGEAPEPVRVLSRTILDARWRWRR